MQANQDIGQLKNQALTCFKENRLQEAGALYAQVCALNPSDAEAWFYSGIINGQTGHGEEAVKCMARVVKLQPQRPEVHFNLGNLLLQKFFCF